MIESNPAGFVVRGDMLENRKKVNVLRNRLYEAIDNQHDEKTIQGISEDLDKQLMVLFMELNGDAKKNTNEQNSARTYLSIHP